MKTKQYRIAITTVDGGSFFSYEHATSTREAIDLGVARLTRAIGSEREIATIAGSLHSAAVSGWVSKSRWMCACKFTHDVLSTACGPHIRGQGCGAPRPAIVRGSEQDLETERTRPVYDDEVFGEEGDL